MRHVALPLAFLKHSLELYQLMFNCERSSIKLNVKENEWVRSASSAFSLHERNTLFLCFALKLSISLVSSSAGEKLWFLNEFPTTQSYFDTRNRFRFRKLLNMLITNNRLLWYLSAFGNISIARALRYNTCARAHSFHSDGFSSNVKFKLDAYLEWEKERKIRWWVKSRVCTNW